MEENRQAWLGRNCHRYDRRIGDHYPGIRIGRTDGSHCHRSVRRGDMLFCLRFREGETWCRRLLDVAAVHGVGGILGTLMVAFLGAEGTLGGLGLNVKETLEDGTEVAYTSGEQFVIQAQGAWLRSHYPLWRLTSSLKSFLPSPVE